MGSSSFYLLAADLILVLHILLVAFVILGLIVIFLGKLFAWPWIRNPIFRLAHVAAIGLVAVQAWFGIVCPLTTFEMTLRSRAGEVVYSGTFVSHWLRNVLYYEAPQWVFALCYTAFGMLVIMSWFFVRPRPFANRDANSNR